MSVVTSSLADCLDDLLEVRPFPAAASRLMEASMRESTTVRELTEIIQYDPGLSVRLLKIANSPLYGLTGRIRSVDHATVVLGRRALRDLAVSAAASDMFDSGCEGTAEARHQLLRHSLGCGCIARLLAAEFPGFAVDEAFLAGVVHDVGKLFLLDHDPSGYVRQIAETPLVDVLHTETATYGMAHTVIGQRCGDNWGLPESIVDVIAHHHQPENAEVEGNLVQLVFVANQLAVHWLDEDIREADPAISAMLNDLGATADDAFVEVLRCRSEASLSGIADIANRP